MDDNGRHIWDQHGGYLLPSWCSPYDSPVEALHAQSCMTLSMSEQTGTILLVLLHWTCEADEEVFTSIFLNTRHTITVCLHSCPQKLVPGKPLPRDIMCMSCNERRQIPQKICLCHSLMMVAMLENHKVWLLTDIDWSAKMLFSKCCSLAVHYLCLLPLTTVNQQYHKKPMSEYELQQQQTFAPKWSKTPQIAFNAVCVLHFLCVTCSSSSFYTLNIWNNTCIN